MLEFAMSGNKELAKRTADFWAARRLDRSLIAEKTKAELISALKIHIPTYDVALLEQNDIETIRSRVVHSMHGKRSEKLRALLGVKKQDDS